MAVQSSISSQVEIHPSSVAQELVPFLEKAFSQYVSQIKKAPVYLTRDEAAERLKISLPTLEKYTKAGILTKYSLGKTDTVRYIESEIEEAWNKVSYSG